MYHCIECEGTVRVNYSHYDDGTIICNDCEQEYYYGNFPVYSLLPESKRSLIHNQLKGCTDDKA